jgi:sorting nexin-29
MRVKFQLQRSEMYKSPCSYQIPANLIQAGRETLQFEIHKLVDFTWNKEEFPDQWKESIAISIYKKGDKRECSNYRGMSVHTKFYPLSFSRLSAFMNEIIEGVGCLTYCTSPG